MDWLSCWHAGPVHRYHRSRGYSRWDEDEATPSGTIYSSPSLSQSTWFSMDDIAKSEDLLTIDDNLLPLLGSDSHFQKVYEFLCSEKRHLDEMCCALDVYVEPIRKMQSLAPEEVRILFSDLEALTYCSRDLCSQLRYVITKWDKSSGQIGHLFNDGFWNLYEAYARHYIHISRLFGNKFSTNSEFAEFCHKMESLGKPTFDSLLNMPMKRLASCANELKEMTADLDSIHPEVPLLLQASNEANRLVKLQKSDGNENYLRQIQEHFPQDDLHLMEKDVQSSGGSRWKSAVTKTLGGGLKKAALLGSSSFVNLSSVDARGGSSSGSDRQLILNSAAKLVMGVHSRDRYLFLFNDFLVIAKGRFDTNFRLKDKLMTSSLWVTPYSEKALIIGWPLQNSTFVFENSYCRDLWLSSLKEAIKTEKAKEMPQSIQIKIIKKDCEYTAVKSLLVANHETASHVVERCLEEFHILDATAADFQLCVTSNEDENPFLLSGHEYPFAIWMNSSPVSADNNSDTKIQFVLRNNRKTPHRPISGESNKAMRRGKAIKRLFKRPSPKQGHPKLFGRELSELSEPDSTTTIPYPIMQILRKLFVDGPRTDGVFRKSANHAKLLAVKQSLDRGEIVSFDEIPVLLTAVLLKDFLRNLPNCLLNCQMYHEWMRIASIPDREEQIISIKRLVQMLPPCNLVLLSHLLCVLCNLAKHSDQSKMDASNLAICIGQSLLWPAASVAQKEDAQMANTLVQHMIEYAPEIFGPECLTLLDGADTIRRPIHLVLRGVSADSDSIQSTGAAEDSVCNSLDLELNRSCSEADYSPAVSDEVGFKMQSYQSCDSGLQLGDEVRECGDLSSASKLSASAKMKYFTSSESREEEDDCRQLLPKKLRHSKKKQGPGIPVLQQSSSMDSSVQADSLSVHSTESPPKGSIGLPHDQSPFSFSNVSPRPSEPPSTVTSSKRMQFFQSMLQPSPSPVQSFSMSLGQSMNLFLTSKPVKSPQRFGKNDSGVSFLGSLNSEECSDTDCGRDVSTLHLFAQKTQCNSVNGNLKQTMPGSHVQLDLARRHPPPLSELCGTAFAEECLETPEELKVSKLECSKNYGSTLSGTWALETKDSSADPGSILLEEDCHSTPWNQTYAIPSYNLPSEHTCPHVDMQRITGEKEGKQPESPRRPLIRANAVESEEKLKQGMIAAEPNLLPSQIKNSFHQPSTIADKPFSLIGASSTDSAVEELNKPSFLASTPPTGKNKEAVRQNLVGETTSLGNLVNEKSVHERIKELLYHDKPYEHHLSSSARMLATKQLIQHYKSLDNISVETDSKNMILKVQNRSPSQGNLLINELRTQELKASVFKGKSCTELSRNRDNNSLNLLKDIVQQNLRKQLIMDNKTDKTLGNTPKSKRFNDLRSYYDRYHEKSGESLKSTNAVSENCSSSDQNVRTRISKKHSKYRSLRKRNSDPRLNVEGGRGTDLGRSKSDSSELCRHNRLMLQISLKRRCEMEQSKENFASLENILFQKRIEKCGKSLSAKELSVSVRSYNHHNETTKRKSVTIKDRDWHKELARQYLQSNSVINFSPSRKADISSSSYRYGREVKESLWKSVTDGRDDLAGSYSGKTSSSMDGICFNDRLAGDVFDDCSGDIPHRSSKSSQKAFSIDSGLKSCHPTTTETSRFQGLKLSNTSVSKLRENFLGHRLNSDAFKAQDNCSKSVVSSPSSSDPLIAKSSGRPIHEIVGRIMDDAELLDPANISWSVARLKELYSSEHDQSINSKSPSPCLKSEDWYSVKKTSALPRLG